MATKYIEGTTVKVKAEFRNVDNVLIDPSTVNLKYKTPDGTVTTKTSPDVLNTGVGLYEIYVTLTDAGKWAFRWEGSGNNGSVNEAVIMVQNSQVV